MISIDDLKRRRNEWIADGLSIVMMDAVGCIHRISKVWTQDFSMPHWVVAWHFVDNPYGALQVSTQLYDNEQRAKDWIDTCFSEHFKWFEAA